MKVRGQIIPATGKHSGTYRFTWDWDADHNECTLVVWFHCNTCNNDIAFKNAKNAGVVTKAATCKETSIRTYTFDLSGAELPGKCTWDDFVLLNNDLGNKDAAWNYQTKVMTLNVVLPIDPNNHVGETEIRGAVKETCGDPGYTGDTHCKDCDAKIAEGKRIEPTGDHKGGTATCMTCAICEVCGQSYGELDPKNHAGDIIQKELVTKEPTCSEPGKKTVTDFCSKCMTPVNEKEVEIPATGKHTGGEATCTKKAVCEVCGKEYGEKDRENHNWNEKWYQDGKVHWHECDDCHEGRNMKEHYDNDGDKKCDECGYIFGSVPNTGETPVIGIAVAVMFVVAFSAVLVFKKRRTVC
jgi:LPXTG-motif cell wall-anchored protein